jgi:hypothetical protein
MAYCRHCGKELREGDNVCSSCGTPIGSRPTGAPGIVADADQTGDAPGPAAPGGRQRRSGTRKVILLVAVLAVVVAAAGAAAFFILGGDSPAEAADAFVSAVRDGQWVEASGYVTPDLLGRFTTGESQADTAQTLASACLGAEPQAGYELVEESESTAKVCLPGNEDDYMLLSKTDDRWLILEIGRVTREDSTQSVAYETEVKEDPGAWEGMDDVEVQGQEGEQEIVVVTHFVNGAPGEPEVIPGDIVTDPVTEVVVRGSKPRGTGRVVKAAFDREDQQIRFQIDRIELHDTGLKISLTLTNLGPKEINAISTKVMIDDQPRDTFWVGSDLCKPGLTGIDSWIDPVPVGDTILCEAYSFFEATEPKGLWFHMKFRFNFSSDTLSWPMKDFWVGPFYPES